MHCDIYDKDIEADKVGTYKDISKIQYGDSYLTIVT